MTKKIGGGKTHEIYAASSSERYMNCAGSITLSEKAPPSIDTEWSIEGTNAHTCLEIVLKNPKTPKQVRVFLLKTYPVDMVDFAFQAAKKIRDMIPDGADFLCETKVKLHFISKNMGGTFDAAIIEYFGTLTVIDYKYGAGVVVEPGPDNTQLLMYALGLAHKHDFMFEKVRLVIIQPRAEHKAGPVREWVISIEELKTWEEKFRHAVIACEKPKAKLNAGTWCRWCPAQVICPALSAEAMAQAQMDFSDDGDHKAPKSWAEFTPEQIGRALTAFPHIEKFIAEVRAHANDRLKKGKRIPGWKLVPSHARRQWINYDDTRARALSRYGGSALTTCELLSPAQFEKALPKAKKFVDGHTIEVSNGVTLVPEKDKRSAVDALDRDFTEIKAPAPKQLTGKSKPKRRSK